MATNRYAGIVWDKGTKVPVAGVRVEALDLRGRVADVIAAAVSDAQGYFEITIGDEQIALYFGDVTPIVYFRASLGGNVLASTEKTNRWNAKRSSDGRIEVNVNRPIGVASTPLYIIEGLVADMESGPVAGVTIKLFKRSLVAGAVSETDTLVTATSASNGRYRLAFDPQGTLGPDLIVKAMILGVEAARATVGKAAPRITLDLLIKGTTNARYTGDVRYSVVNSAVGAVRGGIALDTMTSPQIDFLSTQTVEARDEIDVLVSAAKLNVQMPTIPAEIFYAFMMKGVGATADDVFRHPLPMLRRMLEEAASDRLVSGTHTNATNVTATMTALKTAARAALRSTAAGKLRLGTLADNAPGAAIAATERNAFIDKALEFEGSSAAFWSAVDIDSSFTTLGKKRFRFAVEAAAIAGGYYPMVQALHTRVGNGTLLDDAYRLAYYEAADWDGIINALAGVPANTPGATLAEQRVNYRSALMKAAETRFRTARIRFKQTAGTPVSKFLESNLGFDFEVHRVGRYIVENPSWASALTLAEQPLALATMRDYERLYKLTDSWAEMSALYGAGLKSAYAVHQLGLEAVAAVPGITNASKIHEKACWRSAGSAVLRAKHHPRLNMHALSVLPKGNVTASLPAKIADWASLFGTLDQCSCDHCRSVLGPAAYLVDMLEMLDRVPKSGGTAKTALLDRRPDLKKLALSCENATTPLPYIDVVNEILEVRLAAATWPSWPSAPSPVDTLGKPGDLASEPEVLYPADRVAAYRALESQVYPFGLPFHVWQEEARAYLDHLGVPRDELLQIFGSLSSGPNPRLLALEQLRITGRQYDIIAGPPAPPPQPYQYWGVASGSWPSALNSAKTFLEKSGLSFNELLELMATESFKTIGFPAGSACDLTTLTITGLDAAKLDLAHRLTRLRFALGFSISDTDRALRVTTALDATGLARLAALKKLASRLGVGPRVASAWYAEIDRWNKWEPSLYERVFLSPAVTALGMIPLKNLLTTDTDSTLIGDVSAGIAAALEVSDADLRLMIDSTAAAAGIGLPPVVSSSLTLSITSLSRLYRVASFAHAIRHPVRDFLLLRALSGQEVLLGDDGGSAASPQNALAFLSTLERFDRTGLSADEAHYVIRNFATKESGLAPTAEQLAQWDAEVLKVVARAAEETRNAADPKGTTLASLGAALFDTTDQAKLTSLAEGTLDATTAEGMITGRFAPFLGDTDAAVAALVTAGTQLVEVEARRAYLVQRLGRYLSCAAAARAWVSRTFEIAAELVPWLLGSDPRAGAMEVAILTLTSVPGAPGIRAFVPVAEKNWTTPAGVLSDRTTLYKKLKKASLVLGRLEISLDELTRLYPNGGADPNGLPFLDFQNLPTADFSGSAAMTATDRARFTALLRLADLAWVRDRYAAGSKALFQFFAQAPGSTLAQVYDRLAADCQIDRTDVEDISAAIGASVASFQSEQVLLRIFKAVEALRRMGATARKAKDWLNVEAALPANQNDLSLNALTIARDIKQVARAKYADEAAWVAVARDLRNPLR